MKSALPKSAIAAAWIAIGAIAPSAQAASGTWVLGSGGSGDWTGNWSDTSRWSGNTVADGAGSVADLATINVTSAGMVVTIDSTSRTVGKLYFGDSGGTAGGTTVAASGGASLIFDNGGSTALLRMGNQAGGGGSTGGNPVATVSAPILLNDSLNVENNFNLANSSLRLSGGISAGTAGTKVLTNITNAGNRANAGVSINSSISDGVGKIALVQNSTTGNMTLSAANSYSGGTTVTAGTLLVTAGGTLGTGDVHVGPAGTLDLSGINAGSYSFSSTQKLSGSGAINASGKSLFIAGIVESEGLEVTGNVMLANSAQVNLTIGGLETGEFDRFDVSGLLTLGGTLNLATTYSAQLGDSLVLFDAALITGAFDAFAGLDLGGGLYWDVSSLSVDGSITVIPEPGTLSLIGLAGAAAFFVRRRMNRA